MGEVVFANFGAKEVEPVQQSSRYLTAEERRRRRLYPALAIIGGAAIFFASKACTDLSSEPKFTHYGCELISVEQGKSIENAARFALEPGGDINIHYEDRDPKLDEAIVRAAQDAANQPARSNYMICISDNGDSSHEWKVEIQQL